MSGDALIGIRAISMNPTKDTITRTMTRTTATFLPRPSSLISPASDKQGTESLKALVIRGKKKVVCSSIERTTGVVDEILRPSGLAAFPVRQIRNALRIAEPMNAIMELEDLNGVQMEWQDKGIIGHKLRLSYQGRIVAAMKSTLALNRVDACFDQREVEIEEHLSTKKAYTISSKDLGEEICSLSMILFNAS